jgi:hypothetical protein
VGRSLEAGDHLEVGPAPAGGVASAGLGTIADGDFSGGHGDLLKFPFLEHPEISVIFTIRTLVMDMQHTDRFPAPTTE